MKGRAVAVHRQSADELARDQLAKRAAEAIRLIASLGVEGDRHCGPLMTNHNRFRGPRMIPNVRQVHLMSAELQGAYAEAGFEVHPGEMGENITTSGIDLLSLPTGVVLHMGEAAVELTGFRTPCFKLDKWRPGLKAACLDFGPNGESRKPGVMGVVRASGLVRQGDAIRLELPPGPHKPLGPV